MPLLAFLHIEKAAGTSMRALLDRLYGRDTVTWRGRDLWARTGRGFVKRARTPVIGGHISLSDFPSSRPQPLFLSLVREPNARCISFFYYLATHAPDKDRRLWRMKGLDPTSMTRTIHQCAAFRKAIKNRQCYRLSGEATFEKLLDRIENAGCIFGDFAQTQLFISRVSSYLYWPEAKLRPHNTAKEADYQNKILNEPGLTELIAELNEEDRQLYNFVSNQGYFEQLGPQIEKARSHLATLVSTG